MLRQLQVQVSRRKFNFRYFTLVTFSIGSRLRENREGSHANSRISGLKGTIYQCLRNAPSATADRAETGLCRCGLMPARRPPGRAAYRVLAEDRDPSGARAT